MNQELTWKDQVAIEAMKALIGIFKADVGDVKIDRSALAEVSYDIADSMFEEREKRFSPDNKGF